MTNEEDRIPSAIVAVYLFNQIFTALVRALEAEAQTLAPLNVDRPFCPDCHDDPTFNDGITSDESGTVWMCDGCGRVLGGVTK